MARATYYAALPVIDAGGGRLTLGPVMELESEYAAIARAGNFWAEKNAGGVAFSRTGDSETNVFDPIVILARFGDVPEDLSTL